MSIHVIGKYFCDMYVYVCTYAIQFKPEYQLIYEKKTKDFLKNKTIKRNEFREQRKFMSVKPFKLILISTFLRRL